MTTFIVAVFLLTYLGMAVGRVPGLRIDRVGIALVAAFALLVEVPALRDEVASFVEVPTLVILASLMTLSGELELAGFYNRAAFTLARLSVSPRLLLAIVIAVVGVLSALLTNDVVVFALAPMLVRALDERGLDPRPFLLGAAAASNAGSVATIVGNPQNVLIAQVGRLGYLGYLRVAGPIAIGSLVLVWIVIAFVHREALLADRGAPPSPVPPVRQSGLVRSALALFAALTVLIFAPRPAIGLGAIAAALLISRVHPPRKLLERVDWPTLLLFVGLFIVTGAISSTGLPKLVLGDLQARGFDPAAPAALVALCLIGANTIGNVPLVALVLAIWHPSDPRALPALAIFSTLAGNLLLTGSVANLIVVERAATVGQRISFAMHARAGFPITFLTIGWAYLWLHLVGAL